jgi:transposase
MLYLGIDLHSKQFTVNLRDENGEVVCRRQVSTRGDKPRLFLEETTRLAGDDGYVAILEVCGFHDWFTELLPKTGCREVILVQPERRSPHKTDRRDAGQLSELLWVNRHRLLEKLKVQGVRRITPPTEKERIDRRLTQLRRNAGVARTRTVNSLRHILRRLNIAQHCPTKGLHTVKAQRWLSTVALPELDRFEMDYLLARCTDLDRHIAHLETRIEERCMDNKLVELLETTPGVASYVALAIASRIGSIDRFPTPRSLANYFGITPSCRNSGESNQRLGSITKQGSDLVRWLLGQSVISVLRSDAVMRQWYQKIKKRRGSKIARVAVMRRLTVIFWHMLKHRKTYAQCAAPPSKPTPRQPTKAAATPKAIVASVRSEPVSQELGALPPNPRDLSHLAPCEAGGPATEVQPAPRQKKRATSKTAKPRTTRRKKTSGRSSPSALRMEPEAGAQVASQQSPILPSG